MFRILMMESDGPLKETDSSNWTRSRASGTEGGSRRKVTSRTPSVIKSRSRSTWVVTRVPFTSVPLALPISVMDQPLPSRRWRHDDGTRQRHWPETPHRNWCRVRVRLS